MKAFALAGAPLLLLSNVVKEVQGHGFLESPRSRNHRAMVGNGGDSLWWGGDDTTPAPESDAVSLNSGGTLGACGILSSGRDYNYPKNTSGDALPWISQGSFSKGQELVLDVKLTAHHQGHFAFYVCPLKNPTDIPSEACFKSHPLTFIEDVGEGVTIPDQNYPERAYIRPSAGGTNGFSYKYKLPNDVHGDTVLLQWHYITGNSCVAPGYDQYPKAQEFGNASQQCPSIPPDGNGVPEQFWNCAEISIADGDNPPTTPVAPPVIAPVQPPTPVTSAPVPAPVTAPQPVPTPVVPVTPQPVPVTPVTPAPIDSSFIVSTKARCGVSELDARGDCGEDCTNGCPAGQWCWGVHANYCDSKPEPNCVNPVQDPDRFRCGTSELEARELCGTPCPSGWPTNCAEGESCYSVNTNYCASCGYNPNAGRKMIRG